MVTQGLSVCLPLLALLVSFPCSRAGEANVGAGVQGDSLLGTSVLSDVLHKYFARHEKQGQKIARWRPEVEAVLSLVDNMQNLKGINGSTQLAVDQQVLSIIEMLENDTKAMILVQAGAKENLRSTLELTQGLVDEAVDVYTGLKTGGTLAKDCHEYVGVMTTNYSAIDVDNCALQDFDSDTSVCNCVVSSTFEFALTETAKAVHRCDFSAEGTAQECINNLWTEVNVTRGQLKLQHNNWTIQHNKCEADKAECSRCEPKWTKIAEKDGECKGKHHEVYGQYRDLQTRETAMCGAIVLLQNETNRELDSESTRVSQYNDYKYIICVFKQYHDGKNFTAEDLNACSARWNSQSGSIEGDNVGFYNFAGGQLQNPSVDMTGMQSMPACESPGPVPVPGVEGLEYIWNQDDCGQDDVTVSNNIFSPAFSTLSQLCGGPSS